MNLIILVGVGMFLKSKNPQIKVVLADPQVNYLNSWLVLLSVIQKKLQVIKPCSGGLG